MTCSVDLTGPRTSFIKSSYFVIFLPDFWSLEHRVCQNSFRLSLSLGFSSPALPRAGAKWFCICPCGGRTRCSGCQEWRWCGRQLHLLSQAMPTPHYFLHLKMFGSYKISEDKQAFWHSKCSCCLRWLPPTSGHEFSSWWEILMEFLALSSTWSNSTLLDVWRMNEYTNGLSLFPLSLLQIVITQSSIKKFSPKSLFVFVVIFFFYFTSQLRL